MSRILFQENTFYEISHSALYESEYERIVIQNAKLIFPEFTFIKFKPKVNTDFDEVKPDFAIIDKKYRNWWVGEIEMGYHQFNQHILPQVEKLTQAYYGLELVPYFLKENRRLNKQRVTDLLKGKHPSVIVIINTPKPDWQVELKKYNVILIVFEVFRSELDQHIFRIDGDYPTVSIIELSTCYVDPIIPNFVVVDSPGSLEIKNGQTFEIDTETGSSKWRRIDISNKVYIVPTTNNPLTKGVKYRIIQKNDGRLSFSQ